MLAECDVFLYSLTIHATDGHSIATIIQGLKECFPILGACAKHENITLVLIKITLLDWNVVFSEQCQDSLQ